MQHPSPTASFGLTGSEDTTNVDLLRLEFVTAQRDGLRFVHEANVESGQPPIELLPDHAEIVRSVVDPDGDATTLADVDGCRVLACRRGRRIRVEVAGPTAEAAAALVTVIAGDTEEATEPDGFLLRIWFQVGTSEARVSRRLKAPDWDDIAGDFPATTRASLQRLFDLPPERATGRIILFHGPPGTGKTTALRALLAHWEGASRPELIADPEHFFASTAYMTGVLADSLMTAITGDGELRLIVAEDCDHFLRIRGPGEALGGIARLLNLTDGMLGQGNNLGFVITTNLSPTEINPALTRPGRCLASVDFRPFTAGEASARLGRSAGPMTLAELLAAEGNLETIDAPLTTLSPVGSYL